MLNDLNGARLLVVLPLNERQRALLREAAPAAQFRFADDAPALADVLWAEGILGHVPVELVRQNRSLRWLQSDYAGPDIYLAPGVLPETVRRMALQKCRDSRRVSPADKVLLGAKAAP